MFSHSRDHTAFLQPTFEEKINRRPWQNPAKNQFILTQRKPESTTATAWTINSIGSYFLYTHKDLEITKHVVDRDTVVIIIGYFFHPVFPSLNRQALLEQMKIAGGLTDMLEGLSLLSGVYLAILSCKRNVFVVPDACAMREAYFTNREVASSPLLFSSVNTDSNPLTSSYYSSDSFKKRPIWTNDKTEYEGVRRLKPNHFASLGNIFQKRFFPCEQLKPIELNVAARNIIAILQGTLQSATRNGCVMMD
jgi:hypothetical protein